MTTLTLRKVVASETSSTVVSSHFSFSYTPVCHVPHFLLEASSTLNNYYHTVQFMDKNAIGVSAILGFLPDNNLTNEQFNNLATFFYLGVLVSQVPHALAFQHLPVAKYMAVMIFLWALFVSMHCVANSYGPLGEYLQSPLPCPIFSFL